MKKIIFLFTIFVGISSAVLLSQQSAIASGDRIDIYFDEDVFGKATQSIGVILAGGSTNDTASQVVASFGQTPIYIKLANPTASSIAATPFQTLSAAGYKWYFLFSQNSSVTAVLDAYKSSHALTDLVVELETVDVSFIQTLKTNYPGIRIHVGYLPIWPRSRVNEIYGMVQPPMIEGISFWMGDINKGSVFEDIKLTFDTFFDASKAIAGEKVNHPANAILSVSDTKYPSYTNPAQKTAYLAGLVSSTVVSSVQSQGRGGEAPIRYVISGAFNDFSSADKVLLNHFARFMANAPDIVWPEAISNNGDPWDNDFLSNGDTKPIVGVIGKIPTGFYGFLTNTSAAEVFANVGNRIDFASHRAVSMLHGTTVTPNNGAFGIAANDTIVIYPNNLPNITPPPSGPTATSVPGQPTATTVPGQPTATPVPVVSCEIQKRQGNFNCTGAVDETDFTAWKESFNAKSSTLQFFEYWRRTLYP